MGVSTADGTTAGVGARFLLCLICAGKSQWTYRSLRFLARL